MEFSTPEAIRYLREQHGIDLTGSGLRVHIPGNKRSSAPYIYGQRKTGRLFFSSVELDRFAHEYQSAQQQNGSLGKAGRPRK